jgi:peptide/nickel transport system substrate-binding protein
MIGAVSVLVLAALFPMHDARADQALRVNLNSDIRSTTPGSNRDDNTDAVILQIVEGMVAYREDGSIAPLLAKSVDTSADGLTYTFHLRSGVTFQNGAPFSSADVLWSWKRYMDPATQWRCLPEFDGHGRSTVVSVAAPDAATVVFKLAKPSALFLATMARTDCGMTAILQKDSVKTDGSWDKPIGTGPFMLDEWEHGQYVTLKKFPNYAALPEGGTDGYTGRKIAQVDEVKFIIVPDQTAEKTALLAGNLDVMQGISYADTEELKSNPKLTVTSAPSMDLNGFLFQTRDPLLKNKKLRQAIAYALDIPQIVKAVTNGNATPNPSIVPSGSPYYNDAEKPGDDYNLDKAKQLLAEAGYHGEKITMLASKQYESIYDQAVYAQAMMQAAGINVDLQVIEWATQLDQYTSGKYQMMSFSYSARLDPALSYESIAGDKDKQPRKVWDDPEALKLLDQAFVVSDKVARQAIFDKLHALFIEDVPMIEMFNDTSMAAVSKQVEGYKSWVADKPRLWNVTAH